MTVHKFGHLIDPNSDQTPMSQAQQQLAFQQQQQEQLREVQNAAQHAQQIERTQLQCQQQMSDLVRGAQQPPAPLPPSGSGKGNQDSPARGSSWEPMVLSTCRGLDPKDAPKWAAQVRGSLDKIISSFFAHLKKVACVLKMVSGNLSLEMVSGDLCFETWILSMVS